MTIDNIINDTTEWTPDREVRAQTQRPTQGVEQRQVATDGGTRRTTMQAETIQIPAKTLEFWVQVAQLAVLVLIMLRQ